MMKPFLKKNLLSLKPFFPTTALLYSTAASTLDPLSHKKKHQNYHLDPKFYENDYHSTNAAELEFIRTPLYDFAKLERMNDQKA